MKPLAAMVSALSALLFAGTLRAQVPQLINYQGRVVVGGVNFDGSGQFKFALVNGNGTTTYWSNDGTSTAGSQPTNAVALTVTKGLYSVRLGDTALANMTAIPAVVFSNPDVRLRVWFNNGTLGPQLLTPDQRVAAVGYAMMAGTVPNGSITSAKLAPNAVQSGNIAPGAVGNSQLAAGAVVANLAGSSQSGVASGGVVLSPTENPGLVQAGYVRIGATRVDTWQQRSNANAPSPRERHTAVWTGSEMIVWGGEGSITKLNDGARYHAATNTWTALPTPALAARTSHTAVWSGSEMIVWGGYASSGDELDDGARYNAATNTWTALPTANAPFRRGEHTAVWTGSEMIVWGGANEANEFENTGARYVVASNAWTVLPTSNAPSARRNHTAVWTGSEMIIWGGYDGVTFNDGARYKVATNTWTALPTFVAPSPRYRHVAVWTGSEMIVWGGGGSDSFKRDGGRYILAGNFWSWVSTEGAYEGSDAVWTGSEMIVWGGSGGGRYNPVANTWAAVATAGAPPARGRYTTVWTGSEMIVFGGSYNSGGTQYLNDTWTLTPSKLMLLYQKP